MMIYYYSNAEHSSIIENKSLYFSSVDYLITFITTYLVTAY